MSRAFCTRLWGSGAMASLVRFADLPHLWDSQRLNGRTLEDFAGTPLPFPCAALHGL